MNVFDLISTDTVYLEDQSGARTGPYKTSIERAGGLSASIYDVTLSVAEGWRVIRPLPDGREERYTVAEANFSSGMPPAIPPSWDMKLTKEGSLAKARTEPRGTTIHINNSQGIQIGDHNVQHIANSINGLVELIESSAAGPAEKEEAKGLVRRLLAHPTVAAVLGGATSGLLGSLGQR